MTDTRAFVDGPVLTPLLIKEVNARLELNPLIMPASDDPSRPYLKWNMLFRSGQCQRSTDAGNRSWSTGRNAPATWPRITSLKLISRSFPWVIDVKASNLENGVTCGDVIEEIHRFMYVRVSRRQYSQASANQQRALTNSYYHNRSTEPDVPGGTMPEGILRVDWLGLDVFYGGVRQDDRFVLETCGAPIPCTFELLCIGKQMTDEDMRRFDEGEDRRGRRSRSRPPSTRQSSRPPSQPPADTT
ncbi:hypothetical protein K474DRAFT_1592861 [Panus rudis PR-1116 ss-1]|nr:hypothetical protein K474DRAFT_1592861 [Panus rudis PR-1116 ss-1]